MHPVSPACIDAGAPGGCSSLHPLAPPHWRVALVERSRLMTVLKDGRDQATVLVAPAGSGKTVAMAQLHARLREQGQAIAWLSLAAEHNDPDLLQAHLQQAFACNGNNAPITVPRQCVAFVDGLDALTDPPAVALLEQLLHSVPVGSQLIASTRRMPADGWQPARLRGLLRVLGPEVLAVTADEASALLPRLSPDQVCSVHRLLQGWSAGYGFFADPQTADAHQGRHLPRALIACFDQVVRPHIPAAHFNALVQLATLERLTPALLASTPEPPCTWHEVEDFIHRHHYLHWISPTADWVGLQPAFARYLQRHLRCSDPERYRALREHAAGWSAHHGYAADAVRHALELPDMGQAARIIEHAGGIRVDLDNGPNTEATALLDARQASQLPMVFLSQVYHRVRHGQTELAANALDLAWQETAGFTRLAAEDDVGQASAWAVIVRSVVRCAQDAPLETDELATIEHHFHQQQHRQPVLASAFCSLLAHLYAEQMRYPDVERVCAAGLASQGPAAANQATLWIHLQRALMLLSQQGTQPALADIQCAWEVARRDSGADSYEVLATQLARGLVLYERDEAEAAFSLLEPGLQRIDSINGWVRLYAECYAAAAAIAAQRAGWPAAEAILRDGERFASRRRLPRLCQLLVITRLRELVRADRLADAMQLFQSDLVTNALHGIADTPRQFDLQVRATLASAQLLLQAGQPGRALALLQPLDPAHMALVDIRLRLDYHAALMQSHFTQRRWAGASQQLQHAVALAREVELPRLLGELAPRWAQIAQALDTQLRCVSPQVRAYLAHATPRTAKTHDIADALTGNGRTTRDSVDVTLSPRESQVLTLMAQGLINKEIAQRLDISEGTVKTHRKKIHEKLGASSRSQAILRARELLII